MPKQNLGPRLKLNDYGLYEIYWSENGRSKRRATRTGNLPEAQSVLAGFLLERHRDEERVARPTVNDVLDFYDQNHVEESVADKPRQRLAIGQLRTAFGDLYVDELSEGDTNKYKRDRRASRKLRKGVKKNVGKPISDTTIRRELNTLIAAVNFMKEKKKALAPKLALSIELPPHNEPKDRWLERAEASRLLEASRKKPVDDKPVRLSRAYRFIAIGLGTAKRKEAIVTLKWFQVDLKRRVIDFRKKDGSPLTKKRRNVTPISDWLLPILEQAFKKKISEFVLDHDGDIITTFNTACRNAGLADVTPHTLRHTWGTWAAQSGKSMWEIAGVLGCTVETAERNYLHHSPEHLRDVVDGVAPASRTSIP